MNLLLPIFTDKHCVCRRYRDTRTVCSRAANVHKPADTGGQMNKFFFFHLSFLFYPHPSSSLNSFPRRDPRRYSLPSPTVIFSHPFIPARAVIAAAGEKPPIFCLITAPLLTRKRRGNKSALVRTRQVHLFTKEIAHIHTHARLHTYMSIQLFY